MLPRQKLRETRAALVDHFKEEHFVHGAARFVPDPEDVADLIKHAEALDDAAVGDNGRDEQDSGDGSAITEEHDVDVNEDEQPEAGEDAAELDDNENSYGIAAE